MPLCILRGESSPAQTPIIDKLLLLFTLLAHTTEQVMNEEDDSKQLLLYAESIEKQIMEGCQAQKQS